MDTLFIIQFVVFTLLNNLCTNYELNIEPVKTILEDTYVSGWNSWTKNGDKYFGWRYQSLAGTGQIVYGICEKKNSLVHSHIQQTKEIQNQSILSETRLSSLSAAAMASSTLSTLDSGNIPTEFWLFSPLYKTDTILNVYLEITYQMKSCLQLGYLHQSIECKEHLDILAYHTDVHLSSMVPKDFTELHILTFQEGESFTNELITSSSLKRVTIQIRPKMKWLQIAFRDNGSCVLIDRLIAYHLSCPATKFRLINLPETEAGHNKEVRQIHVQCIPGSIFVNQYSIYTKSNDHLIHNNKLLNNLNDENNGLALCMADGTWHLQTNHGCVCDAGYELVEHTETCQACPRGMFKSSPGLQPCSICPLNSIAPHAGFRICHCLSGYFRIAPNLSAEHSCLGPPSAPRNLNAIHINGTSVVLSWDPPIRSGGFHETLYHVQCQGCQIDTVKYQPGNHVNETKVTITGLNPQTRYQFDVYAHNAVSTKTGTMWINVASVMVTTGSAPTYLISDIQTNWLNISTVHIKWEVYQIITSSSSSSLSTSTMITSNLTNSFDPIKINKITTNLTINFTYQLCLFDQFNENVHYKNDQTYTIQTDPDHKNHYSYMDHKKTNINLTYIENNINYNNNHSGERRSRRQFLFNKAMQQTDLTYGTGLIGYPDAVHYTGQTEVILYNLYSKSGFLIQIRAQSPNAYCPFSSPILLLSPKFNITANTSELYNNHRINKVTNESIYNQLDHIIPISTATLHSMSNQKSTYISSFINYTIDKLSNRSSSSTLSLTKNFSTITSNPSVITIGLFLSVALTTMISMILLITLIVLCIYRKERRRKLIQKKISQLWPNINQYFLFNLFKPEKNKNKMKSVLLIDNIPVNIIPYHQIRIISQLSENRCGSTYMAKLFNYNLPTPSVMMTSFSRSHDSGTIYSLKNIGPTDNDSKINNIMISNIVQNKWNQDFQKSPNDNHPILTLKNNNDHLLVMNDFTELHNDKLITSSHPDINNSHYIYVFIQDFSHLERLRNRQYDYKNLFSKVPWIQRRQSSSTSIEVHCKIKKFLGLNEKLMKFIKQYTQFDHVNIVKFYGLSIIEISKAYSLCSMITEFCINGSVDMYLKNVLQGNQPITLDNNNHTISFNLSQTIKMLLQILSGLEYLTLNSYTVENFTSKSVFLDGCFNCKLKIQFNSVVCSNKQYPTIDNNKINDGFFQPLLLNNEFTNDYLHSTIRKDTKRLDKYDIHQSFRMNPSYNNNNVQQSFSCMNNDNLYEMYQIIITKVTLLNEHTKGIDNKIENLNQSSTSILLTTNCYLSNIYSFSQLIIELIMAQLMLENKHKFIDIIQLFNKNHNGHCYQNMNLLDRNSVSTWNLNSSSADKFSSSNTSYLYPTSIVHNLLQSPQPPLQQENLDTSEDNYKDMKHSLISSDRTIECQTLPTMKQLSNPSCHSLTNSPNLNTTLPMIIHM
uniref:Putative ephrin receptor n=1 Tax=Schistosoma mansoni TaxID=6183 RepID=A0A3Q0KKM4_SCHMA